MSITSASNQDETKGAPGLLSVIVAPLLALVIMFAVQFAGLPQAAAWTIGIVVWTAGWWIAEVLPLPITALVPFIMFPCLGILSYGQTTGAFGNPVILLLLGSFMLSKALEKSGGHKRLAFSMLRLIGTSGKSMVAGFMLTAAVLSMWVSNTATTLMLLPIALAAIGSNSDPKLKTYLMLGIAYSASVGGVGTLIGTPPNLIFAAIYSEFTGTEFAFLQWMKTGLLCVAMSLPVMILILTRGLDPDAKAGPLPNIGPIQKCERRALAIFAVTVLAWCTRLEPMGGWSGLLGTDEIGDATIVLCAVGTSFLIPDGRGGAVLDWDHAADIPWGLLLLFASGILIATAFNESGLSDYVSEAVGQVAALPTFALIFLTVLTMSFLTELTSSTASASLVLPIAVSVATASGLDPLLLMIPATVAASCSFTLPVSTAPNAIVMSSGLIKSSDMFREGLILNFAVATTMSVACWLTLA